MADPIQADLRETMNALAHELDLRFNPRLPLGANRTIGFFLAVFHFGAPDPGKRFNYISNTDKLDVEKMLDDVLTRQRERITAGNGHTLGERNDAMIRTLKRIEAGVGVAKEEAASVLRFVGEAPLSGKEPEHG